MREDFYIYLDELMRRPTEALERGWALLRDDLEDDWEVMVDDLEYDWEVITSYSRPICR